jgi:prepilin-type N-terminal cleavage/methylation domain-containing protein
LKTMSPLAFSSSNSNSSHEAGFSLLELAIVLVILGLIGGASLPLLTAHISRVAIVKTRSNQDYALSAIAAYVEKNNRFPCPADPQVTGPGYGVAQNECRGQKAQGILPFKSLGMSEAFAKDGFKRLMTYVVDPDLTKKGIDIKIEKGGTLTVKQEGGESVLAPPQKEGGSPNCVALILISHGESGIGAFMGNGQATKMMGDSASPHKKENYDGNFVFVESSQTDDILRWESRDLFLKHYVWRK